MLNKKISLNKTGKSFKKFEFSRARLKVKNCSFFCVCDMIFNFFYFNFIGYLVLAKEPKITEK